jgi:hypothetical protein
MAITLENPGATAASFTVDNQHHEHDPDRPLRLSM